MDQVDENALAKVSDHLLIRDKATNIILVNKSLTRKSFEKINLEQSKDV
jgi:hypothetical protein